MNAVSRPWTLVRGRLQRPPLAVRRAGNPPPLPQCMPIPEDRVLPGLFEEEVPDVTPAAAAKSVSNLLQNLVLKVQDLSGSFKSEQARCEAADRELAKELATDLLTAFSLKIAQGQFSNDRVELTPFVQASEFTPRNLLEWGGNTPLSRALIEAIAHIRAESAALNKAGIPLGKRILVLLSDGGFTDGDRWEEALQVVHRAEREEKLIVFPIGMGNVVPAYSRVSCKRQVALLQDGKIEGLYKWLAEVLARVSRSRPSDDLDLPSIESWGRIKGE